MLVREPSKTSLPSYIWVKVVLIILLSFSVSKTLLEEFIPYRTLLSLTTTEEIIRGTSVPETFQCGTREVETGYVSFMYDLETMTY